MPDVTATTTLLVGHEHTAAAIGSGDVPALATPWLLTLFERATVAAVQHDLEPGATTVGVAASMEHTAAAPIGATVEATASIVRDDGRTVEFSLSARCGDRIVGTGSVTRVRVDRSRFVAALS